jgi:hypothetical protein
LDEKDSGRTLRCIRAFSNEINQLLCSLSCAKTFVASTTNQIKIYEVDKFTKKSEYTIAKELRIKYIKCLPHDDKVLAILRNNAICIFTEMHATPLKLVRHFDPIKARDRFLRKTNYRVERLNYVSNSSSEATKSPSMLLKSVPSVDDDKIIKSVTRDYQNGIISDITFHSNGNVLCVAFLDDNSIMLCSTILWEVRRIIAYPDFYIKQCQFIHTTNNYNGSMTNLLLTLTSNDEIMLTSCMSDLNSRMLIDMNNVVRFFVSTNGRLLINLHHSGELFVFNLENHLNALSKIASTNANTNNASALSNDEQRTIRKGLDEIQMKVNESHDKIFSILMIPFTIAIFLIAIERD